MHLLLLEADRIYTEWISDCLSRLHPRIQLHISKFLNEAPEICAEIKPRLIIAGVDHLPGDPWDTVFNLVRSTDYQARIVVMTSHQDLRTTSILRNIPQAFLFNPAIDEPATLLRVIESAVNDANYQGHASAFSRGKLAPDEDSILRMLTPTEQLVLAVIGDGSDDQAAANQLKVQPSAIHSVRRDLHRKLGIQHKGDLIRMAARFGYVRFTPQGVVCPGLAMLLIACRRSTAIGSKS